MSLILQPAAKENATQRAEVQLASYSNDPILQSLMPRVPHDEKVEFVAGALWKGFGMPGIKDMEIIDTETGKVVAFARWKYPTPKLGQEESGFYNITFPHGTNFPLCVAFFGAFKELAEKYSDSEKMYFLNYMHVHPAYQRRGLGQRLMEQALIDADRDGAQAFLLATDAGNRLYSKFGFIDLEEKSLDLHLGANGKRKTTAQIRDPQPLPLRLQTRH